MTPSEKLAREIIQDAMSLNLKIKQAANQGVLTRINLRERGGFAGAGAMVPEFDLMFYKITPLMLSKDDDDECK